MVALVCGFGFLGLLLFALRFVCCYLFIAWVFIVLFDLYVVLDLLLDWVWFCWVVCFVAFVFGFRGWLVFALVCGLGLGFGNFVFWFRGVP